MGLILLRVISALGGMVLILGSLIDAFNTVIVPRRVRHIFRLTRLFYRLTWRPFAAIARRIRNGGRREEYLSLYGPLSLLSLLACWAAALILGFGLVQWSGGALLNGKAAGLQDSLYLSAASLFTIGPFETSSLLSRWLAVLEAGLGLAFLGMVVGYLPVLYQSYSSRELRISLLDARAGSPPAAGELLARLSADSARLEEQLVAWEEWSAELLEEQLSYPMLAYFRSQHQNQSWLAALIALVDATAVVLLSSREGLRQQAHLTFAIGRHALVDLATVFETELAGSAHERLSHLDFSKLLQSLRAANSSLDLANVDEKELAGLRSTYEPYAYSLGAHFLVALPPWLRQEGVEDNWRAATSHNRHGRFAVSDPFQHRGRS